MNIISDILYWISTGLLVPDIVLLIVLFGRALLLVAVSTDNISRYAKPKHYSVTN